LSNCRNAAAKGAAGKQQSGNGKPPPRLSMVYGDELSPDRVFKSRESVFAPGEQLDSDSEDNLYHGEESPLPDELLAQHKQGQDISVRTLRTLQPGRLKMRTALLLLLSCPRGQNTIASCVSAAPAEANDLCRRQRI
jgi:hypothetical protein